MSGEHPAGPREGGTLERPQPLPPTDGWSGAAMAVHAVRRMPQPVFVRLDVVGVGSATVDTVRNEYAGDLDAAVVPARPECVVIATHPVAPGAALADARDLDALLWTIGVHAFDSRPASWLWADERYRLVRWPNLLDASADDVRLFAALAHAPLSPAELAAVTGVDEGAAQRAVNALTLMGVLDTASHSAPPQPAALRPRARQSGLFGRLRRRLGFS